MFVRFNDEPKTDYAHIGERVKYLPQNLFVPGKFTLGEAFRLYGVDYDELVRFDPKFHSFSGRCSEKSPEERPESRRCSLC